MACFQGCHGGLFKAKSTNPIVQLPDGSRVEGKAEKDGTRSFHGIPYAEPPVGDLRFRPPIAKKAWENILDCTGKRPTLVAMQYAPFLPNFVGQTVRKLGMSRLAQGLVLGMLKLIPLTGPDGEDCLHLRISTPGTKDGSLRPVMVWIHGGDHQAGSGSDDIFKGNVLSKEGNVVVVYINYRLNIFGYFAHPELSAETPTGDVPWGGDAGVRDQLLALHWVQKNIKAFGGDPANVTIFGESAGGESVMHLLSAPSARGLFHKAIAQSPNCGVKFLFRKQKFGGLAKSAEDFGLAYATRMVGPEPGQLERMRKLPAKQLQKAYEELSRDDLCGFYVCVGNATDKNAIIPDNVYSVFSKGLQHQVPLLLGYNADEGSVIAPMLQDANKAMCGFLIPMPTEKAAWTKEDVMKFSPQAASRLSQLYPGLDGARGDKEFDASLCDIVGDHLFGRSVWFYGASHKAAPAFMYFFKRVPRNPGQTLGAAHAAELRFVHGGESPFDGMDEDDKALGRGMRECWTSFAATGRPVSETLGGTWEPFKLASPTWMEFDTCGRHGSKSVPKATVEKMELLLEPLKAIMKQADSCK
eukprot:TRINITY_DN64930_c0_g1_i1.p1 TRINITY_DN64930_c0_g1~~TRINITY_DN64930_c0_g1_i1.p1  ORF type:complete len:583 (-),score=78.81 TRINITY_DN64930_c0_g1_i1:255-2003(-)